MKLIKAILPWIIGILLVVLLMGCTQKVEPTVRPTEPAKVVPVKVNWKVIADVRTIDGKQYLVTPFQGQPLVALTYPDSLRFRSWLNDVKRSKDQTDNVLCFYGYANKCVTQK